MEAIHMDQVQNVNNEANQVISDCLNNRLILRTILEHFTNEELLALSFVNRIWKYEARTVMRNRGTLIAHFKSWGPCHDLLSFESDLRQMDVVPFSGMKIVLEVRCRPSAAVDLTHAVILDRIQWKYLSFTMLGTWRRYENKCAVYELVKKILQDSSGVLEHLSLNFKWGREEFIDQLEGCVHPRLKILELGPSNYSSSNDSYTNEIKALLKLAPNLQELHTEVHVRTIENLMEGSSAMLVPTYGIWISPGELPESFADRLRVRFLTLNEVGQDLNLNRFNRIIPKLLQTSQNVLASLIVNVAFAVPLMFYRICFVNVKAFNMSFPSRNSRLFRFMKFVKYFDFTRIFPNLTQVTIIPETNVLPNVNFFQEQICEIIEHGNGLMQEPLPGRACNADVIFYSLGNEYEDGVNTRG